MQKDLQALWQDIVDKTIPQLPGKGEKVWLDTCNPVAIEDGELVVDVANVFIRERMVSGEVLSELNNVVAAMEETSGVISGVRLSVSAVNPDGKTAPSKEWEKRAQNAAGTKQKNGFNLIPDYNFSSFVVGKSNRLAHAASVAVAETPGEAYNPLFIWGGVGLGKTHLMHAICHYALDKKNNSKVIYVSSEKFINEFIMSIRTKQTDQFKEKYRGVDILLIDDIQFLGDKQSSQEEFFHTFDSLREINKQIVICSDRSPEDLKNIGIEDRLVSRFQWGMMTDIQPPDIETRIAILQKKAQLRNCNIPEDIINFLAQRIPSNIRELEGALSTLIAHSELSGEPASIDNATIWLKDILRMDSKGPTTIGNIQALVSESFEMKVEDLTSSKRTAEIALARQIAMYLCRDYIPGTSLKHIADAFRRKDHTTVMHACTKIAQLLKVNIEIRGIVDNIRNKL